MKARAGIELSKLRKLKYSAWLGKIAERAAKEELEKKGYQLTGSPTFGWVWTCKDCKTLEGQKQECHVDPMNIKVVDECPFGEKWFELVCYAKDVMADAERTDRFHGVFWDFRATKNGQDYIIEVKGGSGRLSKEQRKVLNYAKKIGYKVLIVKVQVDLLLKDFQIEEY